MGIHLQRPGVVVLLISLVVSVWMTGGTVRSVNAAAPRTAYLPLVARADPPPPPVRRWLGGLARAVATDGRHAYLGLGLYVVVLDLTVPESPREIGRFGPLPDVPTDIQWQPGRLYLTLAAAGLMIVDASDPTALRPLGALATHAPAMAVAVADGRAYVANEGDGLLVVDVSDPMTPVRVGRADGPGNAQDVAVQPPYVYVASGGAGLLVIDVSDSARPESMSQVPLGNVTGVAVAGHQVLAAHGKVSVVDVSDPTSPHEVASVATTVWQVATAGGFAVGISSSGLTAFDLRGELPPRGVQTIPTQPAAALTFVDGRVLMATGAEGGLLVMDLRQLAAPRVLADLRPDGVGTVERVAGDGLRLFVKSNREVQIQRTWRSGTSLQFTLDGSNVYDMAVQDDRLFLASYGDLKTVTLRDQAPPRIQSGSVNVAGHQVRIAASAGRIVTAMISNNAACVMLLAYDVDAAGAPTWQGQGYPRGHAGSLALSRDGSLAAWGASTGGCATTGTSGRLELFDVRNSSRPVRRGTLDTSGNVGGVAFLGDMLLAAVADHGLLVVDPSDADHPRLVADLPLDGGGLSVIARGNQAYVGGDHVVHVIDASDPRHPRHLSSERTALPVDSLAVTNGWLWVAQQEAGLLKVPPAP